MTGVVIVTYSDRRQFLSRVINALLPQPEINCVFIVGNNPAYSLKEYIQQFDSDKLRQHTFNENTGSAKGYQFGIKQVEAIENISYIWLLDDDNLPEPLALSVLLRYAGNKTSAFLPLRKDRNYLVNAAKGIPVKYLFPQADSFLGFHLIVFLKRKLFYLSNRHLSNGQKMIPIPMAPYGGLFFNKVLLQKIGYPDERFYLYGDDIAYTYRITGANQKIYLLPEISVEDLHSSWVNVNTTPGIKYLQQNDFRSMFSARNSAYYSKFMLKKNNFMFLLNRNIYMLFLLSAAVFFGKMKEYKVFREMINDGLNSNFDNDKILKNRND